MISRHTFRATWRVAEKKFTYNEELCNTTNAQHPRAYQNFFDQLQREICEYRLLFRSNSKLLSLKKYEDYKKSYSSLRHFLENEPLEFFGSVFTNVGSMSKKLHLWWMIRVYYMRSRSSVEVETLISQIHRIRTNPQRDHLTFVEMERELGVKLFFNNVDIYSYNFRQEYITAKSVLSIKHAIAFSLLYFM